MCSVEVVNGVSHKGQHCFGNLLVLDHFSLHVILEPAASSQDATVAHCSLSLSWLHWLEQQRSHQSQQNLGQTTGLSMGCTGYINRSSRMGADCRTIQHCLPVFFHELVPASISHPGCTGQMGAEQMTTA